MTMAPSLKERQSSLLQALNATHLAANPYLPPSVRISKASYLSLASPHNSTVRVFYVAAYITQGSLLPLLSQLPAVCTDGDAYIQTQSGQTYTSLAACRAQHPSLLTNAQRRLSRTKCVASRVSVLATGGYHTVAQPLAAADRFDCIVVSGAGPQFEAAYLDFADFIVTRDPDQPDAPRQTRLPEFAHLSRLPETWSEVEAACRPASEGVAAAAARDLHRGLGELPAYLSFDGAPGLVLDTRAFLASMRETLHVWLSAFDELVAATNTGTTTTAHGSQPRGYFKLVSIGTGFFATLPRPNQHVNIGSTLQPLLLRCVLSLLHAAHARYPHIAAVEFPDFSGDGLYTPAVGRVGHVQLVKAPWRDVLDFDEEVRRGVGGWVPGVLNPGDCFALVGNELGYGSVEAMIGCNSTLRLNQNYVWNEYVLDQERWIGVDL